MDEKNELNDIILNKGKSTSSNKKILFAIATLGAILIIVVMLMNSVSSNSSNNLPKAVLPPEPTKAQQTDAVADEPLFEDVQVIQEEANHDDLDKIAQKLKQESIQEEPKITQKQAAPKPVKKVQKTVVKKASPKPVRVKANSNSYYVQVGSFSKYAPNKKFLQTITNLGYKYTYHKVKVNSKTLNKVLVGPFNSRADAKKARTILKAKVESGAFLTKMK